MKNILYKSISENKTSHGHKWSVGTWYKVNGELKICSNGFHASKNIIDAMNFISAGYVAKVEVRGESIIEKNKECWSEMKIIKMAKWDKKDSVSLAIYAAEMVLDNFEKKYPDDKRPREAIEAAKAVLKNDNEKTRSAAESAAWSAWSAARSAESAAWSAWSAAESAWSAARSAWSAARSAESAESAAWSAEYDKVINLCHDFVIKRKKL